MTAHPKRCPVTGELHFFGYGVFPPLLTYHRADAAGNLVQSEEITVPGPTMIHDFAITEHSVVFLDLPVVCDPSLLMAKTMPYRWSDDYGARRIMPAPGGLGCPRQAGAPGCGNSGNADVRWFDIEPCYVFHVLNAAERQARTPGDRRGPLPPPVAGRPGRLRADHAAPLDHRRRRRHGQGGDARRPVGGVPPGRRAAGRPAGPLRLRRPYPAWPRRLRHRRRPW